jgi:hypothetical protein
VPRISIAQDFKSRDTSRFPKLKLAIAEKSRIWMPEDPWMEWYHRIEAPMVEHGEPVMEVKETRRGPIETWKMEWIGNAFCIGETGTTENPGPLMLAGIDPDNCPACESAANKTGVAAPQQRFSANIVKYKVRGRGPSPYDLSSPISAEVLIWGYTGRIHGSLHELQSEHGDLRRHDVKIELEDTPGADMYQKIKTLSIIVKPAYTDPKVKEYVTDLWKTHPENRATDDQLRDACLGRDVPRLVLMDMVRRAENQYRQVEQAGTGGGDTGQADSAFNGDLSSGVDALLDSGKPADPWADEAQATAGAPDGGLDEFMSKEEKQKAALAADPDMLEDLASQTAPDADPFADPTDADIDRLPPGADDPFGGETPTAGVATTTGIAAPAAEKSSRTEPKSAESAGTFEAEDLDEPVTEPAKANGRKKAKAEPEPVKAAVSKVMDFDDLFPDD